MVALVVALEPEPVVVELFMPLGITPAPITSAAVDCAIAVVEFGVAE